jgi:hypothetical protein
LENPGTKDLVLSTAIAGLHHIPKLGDGIALEPNQDALIDIYGHGKDTESQ